MRSASLARLRQPQQRRAINLDPQPRPVVDLHPAIALPHRMIDQRAAERVIRRIVFEDRLGREQRRMRNGEAGDQVQRRALRDGRAPDVRIDLDAVGEAKRGNFVPSCPAERRNTLCSWSGTPRAITSVLAGDRNRRMYATEQTTAGGVGYLAP